MEITRTVTIKPYKNGAVVNNEEVMPGRMVDIIKKVIENTVQNVYIKSNIPAEKEFTVTVTFNLKD